MEAIKYMMVITNITISFSENVVLRNQMISNDFEFSVLKLDF